ncbi:MAG: xanthine dehydrogenase family protein subunit M [Clostridia bacterium]|nr:xanthine dehydrogenase family protein subunit M [Clostridia bacterium]
MKDFVFLQPKTVAEAVAMRREHGERLVVYNGGTDIVIQLRDRLIAPDYVMDIKRIPGLDQLRFSEAEGLYIGACVTMNALGGDAQVRERYPYLAEAALSVGSKQVRNRATCVGNIVNASPLCDTGTPLYAADAVICLEGAEGPRELPIREFITFVRRTALGPDEIVTGVRVPYDPALKGLFTKIARRKEVDLSTICATVARSGDSWRLAFGAVAPTPLRLPKTEALLEGKAVTAALIDEAAALAATEVSPIDDVRASRQYRLEVVGVTVRRSLEALA